LSICTRATLQ